MHTGPTPTLVPEKDATCSIIFVTKSVCLDHPHRFLTSPSVTATEGCSVLLLFYFAISGQSGSGPRWGFIEVETTVGLPAAQSRPRMRAVPSADPFFVSRRSCGYQKPKRAIYCAFRRDTNETNATALEKERATAKSNARRAGSGWEGASEMA